MVTGLRVLLGGGSEALCPEWQVRRQRGPDWQDAGTGAGGQGRIPRSVSGTTMAVRGRVAVEPRRPAKRIGTKLRPGRSSAGKESRPENYRSQHAAGRAAALPFCHAPGRPGAAFCSRLVSVRFIHFVSGRLFPNNLGLWIKITKGILKSGNRKEWN